MQKRILEFVNASDLITEECADAGPAGGAGFAGPAREISECGVFSAGTYEEFRRLFKEVHGRGPTAKEWDRYFGLHPDQFARISGKSWESACREVKRMVEDADRKMKKLEARKARAEEVE